MCVVGALWRGNVWICVWRLGLHKMVVRACGGGNDGLSGCGSSVREDGMRLRTVIVCLVLLRVEEAV